jgi:D-alanyl-D-alanine carboxypeptidase/D-alanyl-D-alanine-endopeptidase (penicillin-binding protein 4)
VVAGIIYNRLKSHGITIGGNTVSGVTPAKHRVLAETGRPLLDILQYVMKNSNNFLAEYVFKIIGGAAGGQNETAEKTVEKIHYRMSVNKVPFGACIINDGSGLSRANCLSASALAAILDAAHNDRKLFDPFYATMSIAGIDGTLRKRMRGTRAEGNVHGKTGTLRNVSALAGYVTTRDGEVLCFSMLMNGGNHGAYRSVQDKVAAQLAAFSYSQALASPSASVPSASVRPK